MSFSSDSAPDPTSPPAAAQHSVAPIAAPEAPQRRRFPLMLFYVVLVGLYLLDQGTKYWAEYYLSHYRPEPAIHVIPGIFSLHYVQNDGVAFGMMAGQFYIMFAISLLLFAAGLYYASVLDWNRLETNIAGAMLLS